MHGNKSWERCYVLLNIISPCLIVLCLENSNKEVMDKVHYYIDYKKILTDIILAYNIWNMSDDEIDEEESLSNDYTDYP